MPLLRRCSGAAALHVLRLLCCFAMLLTPVILVIVQPPLLGDVSPHLKAKRLIHLLRKLYEYRLVIDILFGIPAEISCQCRFRTIRTRTLCCCFWLLLLSFLHQRNRRRFILSICSVDCFCRSTSCFVAICMRSIQYGRRASRLYYFAVLLAAVRTSDVLLCPMADGNDVFCVFNVFFLFIHTCFS